MPLVRIDVRRRSDPSFVKRAGQIVYEAMKAAVNVPDGDHFQILSEHDDEHFIFDRHYVGIERTDQLVIIQITFNEGRTVDQKKALFRTIAEQLHAQLGVRREDVFINLVEVKKENWSFGNGISQYAS